MCQSCHEYQKSAALSDVVMWRLDKSSHSCGIEFRNIQTHIQYVYMQSLTELLLSLSQYTCKKGELVERLKYVSLRNTRGQ